MLVKEESGGASRAAHSELLDSIYRIQRHFYDFTRKYFLFGRDTLLKRALEKNPKTALEVGTGTARNLVILSRKDKDMRLFGMDASNEMLVQAAKNVASKTDESRFTLKYGLAEQVNHRELFGQANGFDCIFFSYALSMMPDWDGAIDKGIDAIADSGELLVVDFWDQGGYPQWFQSFLKWWLSLFHVEFKPGVFAKLEEVAKRRDLDFQIESIGRRYAFLVRLSPKNSAPN